MLVAAQFQTVFDQCLGALIAGKRLGRIAINHARELIEEQHQCKPALRGFGPFGQPSRQCVFDLYSETLARIAVLAFLLAEPKRALGLYHVGW